MQTGYTTEALYKNPKFKSGRRHDSLQSPLSTRFQFNPRFFGYYLEEYTEITLIRFVHLGLTD